jgi:hypothetical protein
VPGIDNTLLFIITGILSVFIIAAAIFLKKIRDERSFQDRTRRQRLDYQPEVKPVPVVVPVQSSYQVPKPLPTYDEKITLVENCGDLSESLMALVRKYSLDSFTIGTSDGLIFTSSGGSTAQTDAATYGGKNRGKHEPEAGVVLFCLNHKGSDLTGIIRTHGTFTDETRERIESDTKDILNKWI